MVGILREHRVAARAQAEGGEAFADGTFLCNFKIQQCSINIPKYDFDLRHGGAPFGVRTSGGPRFSSIIA